MADDKSDSIVQVIHGANKYSINLDSLSVRSGEGGDPLVEHLAKELERLTQVPLKAQKLIHKGKSMTDHSKKVATLGVKNGSKIMLIGKKFDIEEDEQMKRMRLIEKEIAQNDTRLNEINSEIKGISNGFLDAELRKQALPKLEKRTGLCIEDWFRQLEKLDALPLSNSCEEVKAMRKKLVSKIQGHLERADSTKEDIRKISNPS